MNDLLNDLKIVSHKLSSFLNKYKELAIVATNKLGICFEGKVYIEDKGNIARLKIICNGKRLTKSLGQRITLNEKQIIEHLKRYGLSENEVVALIYYRYVNRRINEAIYYISKAIEAIARIDTDFHENILRIRSKPQKKKVLKLKKKKIRKRSILTKLIEFSKEHPRRPQYGKAKEEFERLRKQLIKLLRNGEATRSGVSPQEIIRLAKYYGISLEILNEILNPANLESYSYLRIYNP